MKVELIKEVGTDGLWYLIKVDGWCRGARRTYEEAIELFDKVVKAAREPKASEALLSIEI